MHLGPSSLGEEPSDILRNFRVVGHLGSPGKKEERDIVGDCLLEAIVATDTLHHAIENCHDSPSGISVVVLRQARLYEPLPDPGNILADLPIPDPTVVCAHVAEDRDRGEVRREPLTTAISTPALASGPGR